MPDITYDIIVVGGSFGGCAAALAAARGGATVCLLEASEWLGGQYTAQGVNRPDVNRWTETVGSTASYREFEHECRAYYRNNFRLSTAGAAMPAFNPSGAYPGFAVDPLIGHRVLTQMLTSAEKVHVRMATTVTSAQTEGDTIVSVQAQGTDGVSTRYLATYFLDATDLGDLLPMAHVEYRLGAEAASEFHEANAPPEAHADWIQPITVTIALERRPMGEDHRIPKPADYEAIKARQKFSIDDGYISKVFTPGKDLWTYRQYIAAENFDDPQYPFDLTMLNMGSNDYQGGTLPTGDPKKDAEIIEGARQATLSYLYWLQNECPRDDGDGTGYPEIRAYPGGFNTTDGTSAAPYIREGRRINAITTIVQQDLDVTTNPGPRAKVYTDSCGIGFYGGMDIHALDSAGLAQQFINIKPFHIPASALVPVRVNNLLAACKNIGVTHITNGAYRLHPVEWNIGESAGALAAFSLAKRSSPRDVISNEAMLRAYQRVILGDGVPIFWWTDIDADDAVFTAAHLLGTNGVFSGASDNMSFGPGDLFDEAAKSSINERVGRTLPWPTSEMTRGEAAQWLVAQLYP